MKDLKYMIRRGIYYLYAHIKYHTLFWRLFNKRRMKLFKQNRPELSDIQKRVLRDLQREGIATTTLKELFPEEDKLSVLQEFTEKQARKRQSVNHKKKFLVDYFEEIAELKMHNPFLQTALSPQILDVANSYMEMYSTLVFFTLQKTLPSALPLRNSQNWHRDPQEKRIVKVFIYLNDVGEDAGPFVYVNQSAPEYKKYGHLFPQKIPAGSYPGTEAVVKEIPESEHRKMTGKAGTIVFCNTNGLHYGGVATKNPRIMSTFGYTSGTYRENKQYYYDASFEAELKSMIPQANHAIRRRWKNR